MTKALKKANETRVERQRAAEPARVWSPAGWYKSPCAEDNANLLGLGVAPIPDAMRLDF